MRVWLTRVVMGSLIVHAVAYAQARGAGSGDIMAGMAPAKPAPTQPHRTFRDSAWKVSFDYPGDWIFTRKDGEISTFRLDARSAVRTTSMRAVASIPENPFPASTFSGAYFYMSVTPHSNDATCAEQTVGPGRTPPSSYERAEVGRIEYTHGYDQQKNICVTSRDEIYTVYRRHACYRFDLAMNNFCGGEVSGVKDVTREELADVRARMEAILSSVRFDGK